MLLNGETMTAISGIKFKKKRKRSMDDYQCSVRLPKKQAFFTF